MPTVSLALLDGGRRRVAVDLDRLTPRARALAEIVTANRLQTRCPVILESVRTIREMGATADDALFYGADAMDKPHRVIWDHWARYPSGSDVDPHGYLENEARKLPLGYFPVGASRDQRVPTADAARDDADFITRDQVLDLLCDLGRPITSATLYNYTRRPAAGWPGIARYVGRTPQWSRTAIEAYARAGSSVTG